MSEVQLTERLDQALEAMLRQPGAARSIDDSQLAELVEIGVALRALPRVDFKETLRSEFANLDEAEPEQTSPSTLREGFRTVTPYLTVPDVFAEIEFLTQVFGAEGQVYGIGTAGGYQSEYRIGESMIMVGGGGGKAKWKGVPSPGSLHLYVPNVDDAYTRSITAGATSLMPPTDMSYGERGAAIEDVGGNHWYLATAFGDHYVPEGVPNLMPFFNPRGAGKMIEFLKEAFAAEEVATHKSPDGIVQHAEIRIGNSIVEMGEAHGEWQPRPMNFMVYVEDSDEWFRRAMKAEGSISISEPANQPYGGRTGTIQDPFGNTWYLSSQIQVEEEKTSRRTSMPSAKLFRVALQVGDLAKAGEFYARLLDDPGIPIPRGSRHYFNCGPVILALVDVAKGAGESPQPTPDYIYFAVNNLDEIFERAKAMNCLAPERYHDQNAGEIVKRPWGEVSFYVEDPWGNGLCFVDETTLFTGK
ncbi:MAG TPA: VOC family protein [Pyrinomonadaceae bacterium]|nr:VOC family protein [Pyrinomonadaceae bacterium]